MTAVYHSSAAVLPSMNISEMMQSRIPGLLKFGGQLLYIFLLLFLLE